MFHSIFGARYHGDEYNTEFGIHFVTFAEAFRARCAEYLDPNYVTFRLVTTKHRNGEAVETVDPEPIRVNPRLAPHYLRYFKARDALTFSIWLKARVKEDSSVLTTANRMTKRLFDDFACDSPEIWQYENHLAKIAAGETVEPTPSSPARSNEPMRAVFDPATGRHWTNRDAVWFAYKGLPDDNRITWPQSIAYCNDLTLGGFDDWRMPTIEELESIHDDGAPPSECDDVKDRPCHLRLGIEISVPRIWSSNATDEDPTLKHVHFFLKGMNDGRRTGIGWEGDNLTFSALCVR